MHGITGPLTRAKTPIRLSTGKYRLHLAFLYSDWQCHHQLIQIIVIQLAETYPSASVSI